VACFQVGPRLFFPNPSLPPPRARTLVAHTRLPKPSRSESAPAHFPVATVSPHHSVTPFAFGPLGNPEMPKQGGGVHANLREHGRRKASLRGAAPWLVRPSNARPYSLNANHSTAWVFCLWHSPRALRTGSMNLRSCARVGARRKQAPRQPHNAPHAATRKTTIPSANRTARAPPQGRSVAYPSLTVSTCQLYPAEMSLQAGNASGRPVFPNEEAD
jgi:hypothetical protein